MEKVIGIGEEEGGWVAREIERDRMEREGGGEGE